MWWWLPNEASALKYVSEPLGVISSSPSACQLPIAKDPELLRFIGRLIAQPLGVRHLLERGA